MNPALASALFYVHYALLLLYGVVLSAAFAGVDASKKNAVVLGATFAGCGLAQLAAFTVFGEGIVWFIYPILGHLPIALLLCLRYKKRAVTAIAAVATAYLCCQLVNWVGILLEALVGQGAIEQVARILTLVVSGYLILRYAADSIASLYAKDSRSVLIFSIVPFVYYAFDYSMSVYSGAWESYSGPVAEFLPFFLCLTFLAFCVIYHREYEQKLESERNEQIVRIAVRQQGRELEAVKRGENEIRLMRHDMRLVLNNVAQCLNAGDVSSAQKLLERHMEGIEGTVVHRYCDSDIINYILSDFRERCERAEVQFSAKVSLAEDAGFDELLLASLLSNALDNALNAQYELVGESRNIKVVLKTADERLLLSVSNPYAVEPQFVDGMPVARRRGHGYGTQSIRYLTERMGGNCQFAIEGDQFVLRVVIGL